ncbi:MAG TPA: 3-oxoacyl-ACP reductase family protein [Burkholderiaceae bacterium]|nr:3-oxoacyl-ACP reductase family protein [Burkholderiaceae bacterium]
MRLKDKVVIVTGGARGMGRAYCLGLAREGAKVVVNYTQRADAAEEVVAQIKAAGGEAFACRADVGTKADVDAMVDRTVKTYGQLDVMVSNAGLVHKAPLLECTEADIERIFHTNVKGNIFCTQAAARVMMPRKSGKIVLCASIVAVVGEPKLSVYTASKGAILAYTRAAALELAPYQINVNCVLPGTTKTDMSADVLADPVVGKALIDPIPLGRLGTPEDLVGIVLYLASDEAVWTTGQSFIVDGGHTMK